MNREEALRRIDNMVNVLATDIPDKIEISGKIYNLKEDLSRGNEVLGKYREIYEELRDEIRYMEDVPEEIVEKAIILRRVILFLKEYSHSEEMDDKKRWMDFVKSMK